MASYYFFGAQLPSLRYDDSPPMSHAAFLASAARYLSKRDLELLRSAALYVPKDGDPPESAMPSRMLRAYYKWEKSLRNELVRLRAGRLKSGSKFLRPGTPEWDAARVAQAAFQADDPLAGELVIERERWAFIDSLVINHYFDLDSLCAYSLRLQALERRARFRAEEGERGYSTVYQSILENADYRDESGENT